MATKVDITPGQFRFRQFEPGLCDPRSFRVKRIGPEGTQIVICCPKGQWDASAQRCRVATRVQSIRVPKAAGIQRARQLEARLRRQTGGTPFIELRKKPTIRSAIGACALVCDPVKERLQIDCSAPTGEGGVLTLSDRQVLQLTHSNLKKLCRF